MKNLLVAQNLAPAMTAAMSFLRRSDIAVHTAASGEDILKFHMEKTAQLIVTEPGLPGMACETLFHIIRRSETLKKVSLLLLCDKTPHHLELARRCRANAVVTKPFDAPLFSEKVRQLLDVPPRKSYRVLLNITVEGRCQDRPIMCSAENISTAGMLVKAKETLARGDHIACSFYLPDGSRVRAQGEIARTVRQDTSPDVTYYGIRFHTYSPGSEAAIASFIQREQNRTSSSAA